MEIEQKQANARLNSIYIQGINTFTKKQQTSKEYETVNQKAKNNVRRNTLKSINAQIRKFTEDT